MADPGRLVIACEDPAKIVGALNALMPQLAPEVRTKLNELKLSYLQRYGVDGLYERVVNRTVSAVLANSTFAEKPKVIASGERGGVRYEVLDAAGNEQSEPPA